MMSGSAHGCSFRFDFVRRMTTSRIKLGCVRLVTPTRQSPRVDSSSAGSVCGALGQRGLGLRVRLLGEIDVVDDGGQTVQLGGVAQRRVLAMLALRSPGSVPVDRLADMCSVSPGAIRTTLSRLRQLIGA